jgi:hypothetical protein
MEETMTLPAGESASGKKNYAGYIISGVAILAIGFFGFVYRDKNGQTFFGKLTSGLKPMSREEAIKTIEDSLGKKFSNPDGYENDYLIARAKAVKSGKETFELKGKSYNANTGRAV